MKKQFFLFYLVSLTIYLTVAALQSAGAATHPLAQNRTHICGVIDGWADKRYSDQYPNRRYARSFAANLNVGEPRTVRMIYFLPNDRPYRAEMVQQMKDEILNVQTFFADQMEAHGYGRRTFRVETDAQGEPVVHRVEGQQPNSDYQRGNEGDWRSDIEQAGFDIRANVYLIAMDLINDEGGFGGRWGKNGGEAILLGNVHFGVAAHELGHAFGLWHDFSDGAYIMSYGPGWNRLSACHAEVLSVHPYFNPDTSIEDGVRPTVKLISPRRYPATSKSVPIRLKITDSDGLHQVSLQALTIKPYGVDPEMQACRGLGGDRDTTVAFDYGGVISSEYGLTSLSDAQVHPIQVEVVDTDGNVGGTDFVLFSQALQPLTKVSGDNQHGLPNTPLPAPLVVELRDLNDGWGRRGVPVTFTVTAGGGSLSRARTETDRNGRAETTLTLGPNFGENRVEVSAEGLTVTFTAVAVAPVEIPDPNLRAAVLTALNKPKNDLIAPSELATLTHLTKRNANISNLTGLESATNLATLDLDENNITDISPVVGLTNLTWLLLGGNNISDISVLAGLTNLTGLSLYNNNISDISAVTELTNLTKLWLSGNNISDISAVAGLTNLTELGLGKNNITDISPLAGLTNLTYLRLGGNNITDISPLVGLTNLTRLRLWENNIIDISPIAELTNLTSLALGGNNITDISPLVGLTNLTWLQLWKNNITDIVSLVNNVGLGAGDEVELNNNPLNYTSIEAHIPTLRSREVVVHANNLKPPTLEYLLSVSAGVNLIHVPLKVTAVDGVAKTIGRISDLYDALGGADVVNFLITYDTSTQGWLTYFGNTERGTANDKALTDQIGIIAGMKAATSVRLTGKPLGNNGTSTIGLNQGLNLVGLPLRDARINRVSDLLKLEGIRGNVPVVLVTVNGDFESVGRAGDPGDVPITGGQGFLLTAQQATTVTLSGEGWTNGSATAAPSMALPGLSVRHTTPVLALRGSIIDEATGANRSGFRVAVKNLSTGRQMATTTADDGAGYRLTVVDIETMRAATVGDVLEITAQSTNPFIGVKPLRYAVIAEDVKQGWIQLPALVAYEIPKETELLANYPNPFNPETWIPYRLAQDADVKLTIYDTVGQVVRTIDVGHRVAAVYESRSKAIYWDGRNTVGETVSSGVYFYQLQAGSESFLRKMVLLK